MIKNTTLTTTKTNKQKLDKDQTQFMDLVVICHL